MRAHTCTLYLHMHTYTLYLYLHTYICIIYICIHTTCARALARAHTHMYTHTHIQAEQTAGGMAVARGARVQQRPGLCSRGL